MPLDHLISAWPPYSYAVLSALLWAVSAHIVNIGLERIPAEIRSSALMHGLILSQIFGLGVLSLLFLWQGQFPRLAAPWQLAVSGLLTFPLATGMYYLAGALFGARADVASQFVKVKPVFSVLLAILVLGESPRIALSLPGMLVLGGITAFVIAGIQGLVPASAVMWGALTALAWALGEVFFGLAPIEGDSFGATFVALFWGCVISIPILAIVSSRTIAAHPDRLRWLWPFMLHGVLSFALGYSFFFHSITRIGLASTVLINAFWPALAIASGCLLRLLRREACGVPKLIQLGVILLLMGSVGQALLMLSAQP